LREMLMAWFGGKDRWVWFEFSVHTGAVPAR
jgi:hypothetical protein